MVKKKDEEEEEAVAFVHPYLPYWVHIIHDRVLVSKRPTPWRSHNCKWKHDCFHFTDKAGQKLVIYRDSRDASLSDTIKLKDEDVDLDGEQIVCWDIETGLSETFEYINSDYGIKFLFRPNYEIVTGWLMIRSDLYDGSIPEELKKKCICFY